MYSTHNEGKFGVFERFIRTLKTNVYKYMTSVSKNKYVNKLDDIVNKCNNKCNSTIKMKPVDVDSSTQIEFYKDNDMEDAKCKVSDHVRVSKYKNTLAKVYVLV